MEFESGVITEPKVNGTKVVAEVRPIYDEIIITRTIGLISDDGNVEIIC